VVSDRAIKHVHELTEIQRTGKLPATGTDAKGAEADATEEAEAQQGNRKQKRSKKAGKGTGESKGGPAESGPLRGAVLFVVNRRDCASFRLVHALMTDCHDTVHRKV
jgi:hypothetical protein